MKRLKSDTVYQRYSKDELKGIYYSLYNRGARNGVLDKLEQNLKTLDTRIAAARGANDAERVAKLMDVRNSIAQTLDRAGRVR